MANRKLGAVAGARALITNDYDLDGEHEYGTNQLGCRTELATYKSEIKTRRKLGMCAQVALPLNAAPYERPRTLNSSSLFWKFDIC